MNYNLFFGRRSIVYCIRLSVREYLRSFYLNRRGRRVLKENKGNLRKEIGFLEKLAEKETKDLGL